MAHSTATRRNAVQHRPHPLRLLQDHPTRAVLDLGALPTAPSRARAWTRRVLREWQLSVLSDTAELIVSELITNAMLASRRLGRLFIRLTVTLDHRELAIAVHDYCPGAPEPGNAAADDENGRGLLLVEAVSSRSGWYPFEDGTHGKVVWAVLSS
ncbi:MAG TPA: ATP-binding protein [Solirubrobacteraceae bacterium]|nr:ATP-binding protein [Solirubrobacteraceae bacterium]